MPTPSRPYVQPYSPAFKDISSVGTIIIDASSEEFTGRLDDIFVVNQGNGPIIFYLAVIKDGGTPISYLRKVVELGPDESKGIWEGQLAYIVPGDVYFAYTNFETNLATCNVNYIVYNELLPD